MQGSRSAEGANFFRVMIGQNGGEERGFPNLLLSGLSH